MTVLVAGVAHVVWGCLAASVPRKGLLSAIVELLKSVVVLLISRSRPSNSGGRLIVRLATAFL